MASARRQRRVRLGRTITITLSRGGASVSLGRPGRRLTLGRRGLALRIGRPSAGLVWTWRRSWRQLWRAVRQR